MKLFELRRIEDTTGVSGIGLVAQGAIFDNGKCAVTWLRDPQSTTIYDCIEDVVKIHSHGGKTKVVQVANYEARPIRSHELCAYQDRCENIHMQCTADGNFRHIWEEREKILAFFEEKELG